MTTMRLSLRHGAAALSLALVLIVALWAPQPARADIPDVPATPRLVNDLAGIMRAADAEMLEDSLVRFDNRTSTQVCVVTVNDLDGYAIAEYAQELAEKWGIGQKGKDNGVIILVKPKTEDSRGEAYIGTGYGVEGALPDVTCTRIVREVMIPFFKENDYSGGICAGAIKVMQAVDGEFTADADEGDGEALGLFLFFVILACLIVYAASKGNNGGNGGGHISHSSGAEWVAASMMSRGGSSSGWSGGGGFGGGFGGFGGGSFGGGGGGGSW